MINRRKAIFIQKHSDRDAEGDYLPGQGDGDGRDSADITVFNAALGSTIGNTTFSAIYNADCDFNGDGHPLFCKRRGPHRSAI